MGVGRLRGGDDLLFGGPELPVGDVLPHRPVEDERLLQEHGDVVPQRTECQVAQVVAVEPYRASVRVVEAQQELRDRGLASPAWADERERLPGPTRKERSSRAGLGEPG